MAGKDDTTTEDTVDDATTEVVATKKAKAQEDAQKDKAAEG